MIVRQFILTIIKNNIYNNYVLNINLPIQKQFYFFMKIMFIILF